jgi:RNA polymerase sigma-70 factor (ECF subfamily)
MTVLDQRRTAQRQSTLLQEFGDVLVTAQPGTPPTDRDRLARCVQGLKERERSVVVLTFYDERTAADSGRALGLSEANVRVIRHRAIKQLRACMEAAS